jgi:hypothetical protein
LAWKSNIENYHYQTHKIIRIPYQYSTTAKHQLSAPVLAHGCDKSKLTEKNKKAQRRKAFKLALLDDHLIAIGQVALRRGMLDNLIDLTAEQLIQRHSPIIRKELSKFTKAKKIDLIKEALTQDIPESSNAIAEFFGELYSARSERNEIVHRTWQATDTPEVKALVKVKHNEPEEHVRSVTTKGVIALAHRLLDLAISNNAQLRRSASAPAYRQRGSGR